MFLYSRLLRIFKKITTPRTPYKNVFIRKFNYCFSIFNIAFYDKIYKVILYESVFILSCKFFEKIFFIFVRSIYGTVLVLILHAGMHSSHFTMFWPFIIIQHSIFHQIFKLFHCQFCIATSFWCHSLHRKMLFSI